MNNKKLKIFTILISSILMFAVSCMENPSRPKRSSGGEEDVTISLGDGTTVSVPVNTGDYWEDNEKLNEIYSNQMSKKYIYDGDLYNKDYRYKFADNLDMVNSLNGTIYKKYIKSVLVKVSDKIDNTQNYDLHGKYVVGGVYQVVQERGTDVNKHNENEEVNQPKVGGYEIIIDNYARTQSVKSPSGHTINVDILYRYNLPNSDANSNYDPEKVFDETYKRIGDKDDEVYWLILPEQYIAQ